MCQQHAHRGREEPRRTRQCRIEHADHEIRGTNRAPQGRRLLSQDVAQENRAERRADATRAVEHADTGSRASADREDALAEDRQQQQDAARESPSRFHEHERRHVRRAADVADALGKIG